MTTLGRTLSSIAVLLASPFAGAQSPAPAPLAAPTSPGVAPPPGTVVYYYVPAGQVPPPGAQALIAGPASAGPVPAAQAIVGQPMDAQAVPYTASPAPGPVPVLAAGPPPVTPASALPPDPPLRRTGFVIGFAVGAGTLGGDICGGCRYNGAGGELHIGGMLGEHLALMFDASSVTVGSAALSVTQSVGAVAVQGFLGERFWLKGGLGWGNLSVEDAAGGVAAVASSNAAAVVAAGLEAYQGRSFVLDLQLRSAAVRYGQTAVANGSFLLGFNWY